MTASPSLTGVSSSNPPSGADIGIGKTVTFTLDTDVPVFVLAGADFPTLQLNDGEVATFSGGSGTSALTFTYTVQAGDITSDLQAIAFNPLPPDVQILDISANPLSVAAFTPIDTGVMVDGVAPTITNDAIFGAPPVGPGGEIGVGQTVTFEVDTTKQLSVTNGADGAPELALNDGGFASLTGSVVGSTSTALFFTYTVQAGENTSDLQATSVVLPTGAAIQDGAGNDLVLDGFTTIDAGFAVDTTPPSVLAIRALGSSPNNGAIDTFLVIFSENVTGVDASDFTATVSGSVADTGISVSPLAGDTYVVTVNDVTGDGTLRLDINNAGASSITDDAGNPIVGGFTAGDVFTIEHTPPSVLSIQATGSNPSNASSVSFTVTFSEDVTGVDASDFTPTATGTVGATGLVVTPVSGSVYTVTLNGVTGDGTLRLRLNDFGTGITDAVGDPTSSGGFTSDALTIDNTSVLSIQATGSNPSNASSDSFTVTFSKDVTGVDASDFTATVSGTVADGGIVVTPVSGSVYTVTVNDVTGDGTLRLDLNGAGTGITDGMGNAISGGFTGGDVYTIDHTPPSITTDSFQSAPNITLGLGQTETFSITTSEPIFFIVGISGVPELALNDGGFARFFGAIPGALGDQLFFAYTVQPGENTNDLQATSIVLPTGTTIQDGAGNDLTLGSFTTIDTGDTVDTTPPSISAESFNSPSADLGVGQTVTFTLNTSEQVFVTDGVSGGAPELQLSDGELATFSGSTGTGTNQLTFTYTVSPGDNVNDLQATSIVLQTGATIQDAAGNDLTLGSFTTIDTGDTVETTPPSVLSIRAKGARNPSNASSDSFTVTFSEDVTGVDASDFTATVSGTVADSGIVVTPVSGSVYTVTVNDVTGDGTLQLGLNGSGAGIKNAVGIAISGGFTSDPLTIERTPPSISAESFNSPSADLGAGQTVTFTLNTSEQVFVASGSGADGNVAPELQLNDGEVATYSSGTGTNQLTFSYNVLPGDNVNDLQATSIVLPTGATIQDAAGNDLTLGSFTTIDTGVPVETAAPSVGSIQATGANPNNASSDSFTVTFSQGVTGVDASDFTATVSGSVADSGIVVTPVSGSVYTVTVNGVTGDGTLRLDLNSSGTGITDGVGIAISGGFTGGDVYTIEHTPPSVASIQATSSSPNNASSDSFTVTFSEGVTGVNATDFLSFVSGTVTDFGLVVTPVSGSVYTVTLSNVTGDGTLQLGLNGLGAGITDAAGNAIASSFNGNGDVIRIDHRPPSVASIHAIGSSPNNAGSDQFTVTFSEAVTGVDASDFTATVAGTVADTGIVVTPVSGSVYTVTVNGVTGDGTLRLDLNNIGTGITDAAGNPIAGGFTTGSVYTIEHTPPSVSSIHATGSSPNDAGSDSFTVRFSENVTGVDASDFTATVSGTVADTGIVVTRVSGSVYTVTVNGVTGDGTLRLDLNNTGTGITDAAGNPIAGGFTTGSVLAIEHTPPSVSSIHATGSNPNHAASDQFTVTFSENVTGVDASDFTATTFGTVADTGIVVTRVSGSVYKVTVNGVTGNGGLRLDLNNTGTGITDAAGNPIAGGFTGGDVYTIEHTPPSLAFNSTPQSFDGKDATVFSGTVAESTGGIASVKIYEGAVSPADLLGTASVSGGAWSFSTVLAAGVYNQLKVVATDIAGNTTIVNAPFTLVTGLTGPATAAENEFDNNHNLIAQVSFTSAGEVFLTDTVNVSGIDTIFDYTAGSFFKGKPFASLENTRNQNGQLIAQTFLTSLGATYLTDTVSVSGSDTIYDYTGGSFFAGKPYASRKDTYDQNNHLIAQTFFTGLGATYLTDTVSMSGAATTFDYTGGSFFTGKQFNAMQKTVDQNNNLLIQVQDNLDGSHSYLFNRGFGGALIANFVASGPTHDRISVASSDFANFATLIGDARQVGSNVVITALNSDRLTIDNTTIATLTANKTDFSFHS